MKKEEFIENLKSVKSDVDNDFLNEVLNKSLGELESFKGLANLIIVMEELGEIQECIGKLSQKVSKYIRSRNHDKESSFDITNILEEMADTYLGIKYLQKIIGIDDETLNKAINVKLERQNNRVNNK